MDGNEGGTGDEDDEEGRNAMKMMKKMEDSSYYICIRFNLIISNIVSFILQN